MRIAGRLAAAIDILADFDSRRVPLKTAIADWSRAHRFAGAKDRAWISGLCLDGLRRRRTLSLAMGDDGARAIALGVLRYLWKQPAETVAEAAGDEPHGPGALNDAERRALDDRDAAAFFDEGIVRGRFADASPAVLGDFPDWLAAHMARVFGEDAAHAGAFLAERADVDLRVNTLKATQEQALAALKTVKGEAIPLLAGAARIAAPDPSEKAPPVTIIPAFSKGWVEVQDLGSQIAATAAGAIGGAQVLDYCAGGGGKTLALAAMMENKGQLYAFDADARRLKPLYHRAQRAGLRNLQIRNPTAGEGLADLEGRMDVVFVDAPCTGSGTWRRHPDTKWRLTPAQFERRIAEQDRVLSEAAAFVKPEGRLVYVTCSVFMEENEDRLAAFLKTHTEFSPANALAAVAESGRLTEEGRAALAACTTPDRYLRLAPGRIRADGFFIAVLARR